MKVVGFVLKKILTYFEMLIVPHALHFVVAFLYLPHLTQSGILFWFQCPPPPPPSLKLFLLYLASLSNFTY